MNRGLGNARITGERGFTLMEMLVVLVVIGLIAAVAIPQVVGMLGGAKEKAARIQLETLSQSLLFYQLDLDAYPTSDQGLAALWQAPPQMARWRGPYVRQQRQLVDPWGNPFVYRSPGQGRPFDLVSLGADGLEGGDGDNADISAIE